MESSTHKLLEIFEKRVKIEPLFGCWLWKGMHDENGYGRIELRYRGKRVKTIHAHRYVWALAYGGIEDGRELDHLCNTPGCVRPNHLRLCDRMTNNRQRWMRNYKQARCAGRFA